jgi:hypothetical protein
MSVTVRLAGYESDIGRQVRISAPKLGTVVLPWWPDEIASANLAGVYEEQLRPGRTPLLLRSGDPLPEVRIGCIVSTTSADERGSVSTVLDGLRKMSLAKKPVDLKLASRSSTYRITDLGITELDWDVDGNPSSAEVSLTLLSASDAAVPVGPIKKKPKR